MEIGIALIICTIIVCETIKSIKNKEKNNDKDNEKDKDKDKK